MRSIRTITIEELVADMILAEDCVDAQGKTLLPAETVITPQTMTKLQQGQPALIRVWATEQVAHGLSHRQEAELQRIEHLFRHAGDSIYAQALRNAVLTYRMGNTGDSA